MAVIIDQKRRIPFLRGMLTHYLIEHGFTFEEAYEVADRVRSVLQKRDDVDRDDVLRVVRDCVEELFGDRPIGDGIFWEPGAVEILVEDAEGRRPFSRARVSNSLTLTGVDDAQAYRIAEDILGGFRLAGKRIVTREQIRKSALKQLKEVGGKRVAERYQCWHEFRNADPPRPIIILLGGTSGVGKTSIGVALANMLKISRVAATDEIRQVMRLMISQDLMPTLHKSSYAAWESLSQVSIEGVDKVIAGFHEQANRVCVGVRATIDRALAENTSLIIDGVHLIPDIVDVAQYGDQASFVWANLYIGDRDLYRDRFRQRGKKASSRPQHRYLQYMDEIQKLQRHILEIGKANKVPAVENTDFDETIQTLSLHIIDTLRKSMK